MATAARLRARHPFAALVLLPLLFAVPASARAAATAPPDGSHTSRILVMTGEGEASANPDQAQVSAAVVTRARAARDAVADNAQTAQRIYDALAALSVARSAIQTSNFALTPHYADEQKPTEPHKIVGYEVSNAIVVTLDDVTRAGAVLDAMLDAGADRAYVAFSIKDPKPVLQRARADAAKDALARAQAYAGVLGASLGPVLSVNEGDTAILFREPRNSGGNVEEVTVTAERRQSTPISAGEQKVSAEVTVVWALK